MSSAEYSCKLFEPIFAYRQTVWTQIRLLLGEQSDLGSHCLQKWLIKSQEAHGPRVAHVSDIATADMQMCRKIDFQDGCHGGHLGYPIGTILAIFDLQVTPMSPMKFGVNWPFGAGEEAKYRFSRWRPWWPSGISDQNDFSYIWSTSHPDASY